MNEKMMETIESLYVGVRRDLIEASEAMNKMYGYLQCLCDIGIITDDTRSKMYKDFVAKVSELETK